MPDIKQRAREMAKKRFRQFPALRDGTWKLSTDLSIFYDFIDEIIDMRDKEIVEEILSSFEALDKAGQSFPMAIIHWSKKDRENWVKSILSAEALNIK